MEEYKRLFNEKYSKYRNMLLGIAFTYLKNIYDCEDILQDVFIKLMYNSPEFESDEHEKRWLIRVTVNMCKNYVNLFWNRNKNNLEEYYNIQVNEKDNTILKEILRLPEKYKITIYLFYIEGYKCKEIAQILKLKESRYVFIVL